LALIPRRPGCRRSPIAVGPLVLAALTVAVVALIALTVAPVGASDPAPRGATAGAGPSSPVPGFLLDKGRYTSIEVPGAIGESLAAGINNRGQIVGQYRDARGEHGYLRDQRGRLTTFDVPGARATSPVKINDRGQIAGVCSENAPNTKAPGAIVRGFILDRGKVTTIDFPGGVLNQVAGINDRGQVVGDYIAADGTLHGFLWHKGRFTRIDVPGSANTGVLDINDRGQIVGYHGDDPASSVHAFLLDRGQYRSFDAPGVAYTYPFGIDDRGRIVGFTGDALGTELHGFLLRKGPEGAFTRIDVPGAAAPGTVATDINNRGQIVGWYYRDLGADAHAGRAASRSSGDPPRRGDVALVSAALDQPS